MGEGSTTSSTVFKLSPVVLLEIIICFLSQVFLLIYINLNIIVCTPPPPPFLSAGGIEPRTKLDRTSTLRGDCWIRGGNFFQGGGGREGGYI